MINIDDKILTQIKPSNKWIEVAKKDYAMYGVSNVHEAKVVACYKAGSLYKKDNTITLYNYGDDASFINELSNSYYSLQINIQEQNEYGIFPQYWEMFGINQFFSVLKLIHNPIMNIVDVFFVYQGTVYSFHTYLPAEEKNLRLASLMKKYEDIKYIIQVINELKN